MTSTVDVTTTELAIHCDDGTRTIRRITKQPLTQTEARRPANSIQSPHDNEPASRAGECFNLHVEEQEIWLQRLPAEVRTQARQLAAVLEELGCADPHGWTRSEIEENLPQLARYRFLRTLWPQMIDSWHDGALDAGASQPDLTQLARAVAYETVFAMFQHLGDDERATAEVPSWTLAEISRTGHITGRQLDGLHEDLLALDPPPAEKARTSGVSNNPARSTRAHRSPVKHQLALGSRAGPRTAARARPAPPRRRAG
ncbi:hypothetical protein [Plantactinospora sp. BB1]|uniref:hypothetical protein n=1 Tax=Plantactinospora sp. BB1 TaxID=2071627 RepID=UPI0018FEE2D1|nr:hypothetical protein [Plantactinospora sp. BB1]